MKHCINISIQKAGDWCNIYAEVNWADKQKKQERPKKQGTGKNIPNRIDISERPIAVDERKEFRHFEAGSIESCK